MKVAYIAGRFRAQNPDGTNDMWRVQQHIMAAMGVALDVWKGGHVAVCPHANTMFFQHAAPDDVWLRGDLELVRRCDAVIMVSGWEQSSGARAEREYAVQLGIPVFHNTQWFLDWANEGRKATV